MFWPRGPQAGTVHGAICEISTDGATVPDCEVLNYDESSYNHDDDDFCYKRVQTPGMSLARKPNHI